MCIAISVKRGSIIDYSQKPRLLTLRSHACHQKNICCLDPAKYVHVDNNHVHNLTTGFAAQPSCQSLDLSTLPNIPVCPAIGQGTRCHLGDTLQPFLVSTWQCDGHRFEIPRRQSCSGRRYNSLKKWKHGTRAYQSASAGVHICGYYCINLYIYIYYTKYYELYIICSKYVFTYNQYYTYYGMKYMFYCLSYIKSVEYHILQNCK